MRRNYLTDYSTPPVDAVCQNGGQKTCVVLSTCQYHTVSFRKEMIITFQVVYSQNLIIQCSFGRMRVGFRNLLYFQEIYSVATFLSEDYLRYLPMTYLSLLVEHIKY